MVEHDLDVVAVHQRRGFLPEHGNELSSLFRHALILGNIVRGVNSRTVSKTPMAAEAAFGFATPSIVERQKHRGQRSIGLRDDPKFLAAGGVVNLQNPKAFPQ
jgi:hypothetical protein